MGFDCILKNVIDFFKEQKSARITDATVICFDRVSGL